jgi:uridylate kinase
MTKPRRVLLKLSGEALMGDLPYGVDQNVLSQFVSEIAQAYHQNIEIAIVVGGGNIFRGVQGIAKGMDRSSADYVGMMATVMNSITLVDAMRQQGVKAKGLSSIEMPRVMDLFSKDKALEAFDRKEILVFAGGTGSPFFTTDTAAALKAAEIGADILLKATQVDGIYEADPKKIPDARRFQQLSYQDCLTNHYEVMDTAAFSLCRDHQIPIRVFSLKHAGAIASALQGANVGTLVAHGLTATLM